MERWAARSEIKAVRETHQTGDALVEFNREAGGHHGVLVGSEVRDATGSPGAAGGGCRVNEAK